MAGDRMASLKQLSDDELEARVKSLAARERGDTAELVAHLAELDTRDLHLRSGYGSLFAYCRDALHLSEHEAATASRPRGRPVGSPRSWSGSSRGP
jgi:hypothetical protein